MSSPATETKTPSTALYIFLRTPAHCGWTRVAMRRLRRLPIEKARSAVKTRHELAEGRHKPSVSDGESDGADDE